MKAEEIREMSLDEIENHLDDSREELMRLRFQAATGELTDPNQLRFLKKRIARMLTILHEREGEVEGEA
jgi:large subunit ribosomal protein L29